MAGRRNLATIECCWELQTIQRDAVGALPLVAGAHACRALTGKAIAPARHLAALAQRAGGHLAALNVDRIGDANHIGPVALRQAGSAAAQLAPIVLANAGNLGGWLGLGFVWFCGVRESVGLDCKNRCASGQPLAKSNIWSGILIWRNPHPVVLKEGAGVAPASGDGNGGAVAQAAAGHLGGPVGERRGAQAKLRVWWGGVEGLGWWVMRGCEDV